MKRAFKEAESEDSRFCSGRELRDRERMYLITENLLGGQVHSMR